MRSCPECGTEYEDHVPTCLADGAVLVAATPRAATAATPAPAEPGRSGAAIVLLLIPLLLVGALAVGGIALFALAPSTPEPTPPSPKPAVTVEAPVPAPPPPAPVEVPPVEVAFVTLPEGARIFENDQFVCNAPCTVKHPSHAPLPRSFVIKADGYLDQTFEMTEAAGPYLIELTRRRAAPVPAPARPTPTPEPAAPTTPRPSIGRDREKGG